jgi:hypothetical protein
VSDAFLGLYYFNEVTMKRSATAIGVNESRVSQLHARAIQRCARRSRPERFRPRWPASRVSRTASGPAQDHERKTQPRKLRPVASAA